MKGCPSILVGFEIDMGVGEDSLEGQEFVAEQGDEWDAIKRSIIDVNMINNGQKMDGVGIFDQLNDRIDDFTVVSIWLILLFCFLFGQEFILFTFLHHQIQNFLIQYFNPVSKIMHNSTHNVLLCPDKFKGSLHAQQVAKAVAAGLPSSLKTETVTLGDGGQGSLTAINQILHLQEVKIQVNDPLFRPIEAMYLYDQEKQLAFIEMAEASGLERLKSSQRNPMKTSTYGTGQLINSALTRGAKGIYLFVGGSATNECGIGMASALGYDFYDEKGEKLAPIGQSLPFIANIKKRKTFPIDDIKFYVVTDVKNTLCGSEGASAIYGSQKGASPQQIHTLDQSLQQLDALFVKKYAKSVKNQPGSGAAGGLGAGCLIFLNAKILPGIETVIEIVGLEEKVKNSDLIITGQGKLDRQTLNGKVVQGVRRLAQKYKKEVWVVCGVAEIEVPGVKVIPLVNKKTSVEEALKHTGELLGERIREQWVNKSK